VQIPDTNQYRTSKNVTFDETLFPLREFDQRYHPDHTAEHTGIELHSGDFNDVFNDDTQPTYGDDFDPEEAVHIPYHDEHDDADTVDPDNDMPHTDQDLSDEPAAAGAPRSAGAPTSAGIEDHEGWVGSSTEMCGAHSKSEGRSCAAPISCSRHRESTVTVVGALEPETGACQTEVKARWVRLNAS